jgi:hypothetical protein
MAMILQFRSLTRPALASALAAQGPSGPAEIVLFPGIRYEQQIDEIAAPLPVKSKPKKNKPKRDTIEIDE